MAATLEAEAPVAAAPLATRTGRPWWERLDLWAGLLVVAACCAFVFVQLDPSLLLRNTTPSGGDTAAHVWWPAYLRDHLLPWRLAGWSPDFYNGFAAGQYYFPVPALLIVIADVVLPYNIAFKLVTALGPVLLPLAAYILGRGIRAPAPAPAAMAIGATAFLFFNGDPGSSAESQSIAFNQHIMGGTLASNLAGEFSFTLALAFALAFLGTLAFALRTGRRLWAPALLLALAVMSHLVVAIFAAVGGILVWLAFRPRRTLPRAAVIAAVGALLTAVWLVPLVATLKYTTDMRYEPVGYCPAVGSCDNTATFSDYLFPSYLFEPDGALPWQWGAYVLVGIALVAAIVAKRRSTFLLLTLVTAMGLIFRFWENVKAGPAWNLRFVPFWYLGVFLLMAIGVAELVRGAGWLGRRVAISEGTSAPLGLISGVVACVLTVVLALGTLVGIDRNKGFLPYWVRWNYRGYEDEVGVPPSTPPKSFSEYRTFIDAAADLPPGRLTWEGNTQLNAYGSPLALMLLPYWTDGRISSMEGVYYEASASTPYHFMTVAALVAPGNSPGAVRGVPYRDQSQFALGVRWLQLTGVRYLAVHSAQSRQTADGDPRLRLVATTPDFDGKEPNGWSIYRVADAELVAPLAFEPVVAEVGTPDRARCEKRMRERLGRGQRSAEIHEWPDCIAVPWFDDPDALDRPLVADGPEAWQRAGAEAARAAPKKKLPEVRVTRIRADDDSISFRVSRTGVPVYVKTSWYPNWEVDGADGPYRATPNLMVVVPTERDVTMRYGTTTAEWLGRAGTLVGIAGLAGIVAWPRFQRRRLEQPPAVTDEVPAAGE